MSAFRILHIDDDNDIRLVVGFSLRTQNDFEVRSCASGVEGIAEAIEWSPHLIICDVMMPELDGPATLARLRENPQTRDLPVIFMTARAQEHEVRHFESLGARAVITKPFSPKQLCDHVRRQLEISSPQPVLQSWQDVTIEAESEAFLGRLRADLVKFAQLRRALSAGADSNDTLLEIKTVAHKLAGAAACFGFADESNAAAALESAVLEVMHHGKLTNFDPELSKLLECLTRQTEKPLLQGVG